MIAGMRKMIEPVGAAAINSIRPLMLKAWALEHYFPKQVSNGYPRPRGLIISTTARQH
jgi:hypothetical protein